MRILHTSDWHLGRSFAEFRLLDDQVEFLSWLAGLVASEKIDLVAVSGDLYDRSVPPADAVAAFRDAIAAIRSAGARIVAIAGNHDSPQRVAAFDGLTEASGLLLRGGYERASRVEILDFEDGPLAVAAVPFLDPILAPESLLTSEDDEADRLGRLTHADVMAVCLDRVRSQTNDQPRSLVLAHAFVAGGIESDSERQLGGTGRVPADLFSGFSYVALGHLHRPQKVGGSEAIRYSGSPLAYSFSPSEVAAAKKVVVVDMAADGAVEVTEIEVPVGRQARLLKGTFADLIDGPDLAGDPFVRIELGDRARIIDGHSRLSAKYKNLAELVYVNPEEGPDSKHPSAEAMARLSPIEHVRKFWEAAAAEPLDESAEQLVSRALNRVGGGDQ